MTLKSAPLILSIETSCDDTSVAILEGKNILGIHTSSQREHAKYGGVVPELASRLHQQSIVPTASLALQAAQKRLNEMDAIAVTVGPGLFGSMVVGTSFAKALALAMDIPLIGVNHLRGHVLSVFLDAASGKPFPFPFLCLLVSGGNTMLIQVEGYLSMKVLGQTLDDAVGEAFDKAAKLMGLPYPGGPLIDGLACQGIPKFSFPRVKAPGLNFSFSGIKTALYYFLKAGIKNDPTFLDANLADICASYQQALTNILLEKLQSAIQETGIKTVGVVGGVSANAGLRAGLKALAEQRSLTLRIPPLQYCTDNAAMIGLAAYYQYLKKAFSGLDLEPLPNYKL